MFNMFLSNLYIFLILSIPKKSGCTQQDFDGDVDDLIKAELGEDPFSRRFMQHDFPKKQNNVLQNISAFAKNYIEPLDHVSLNTTEKRLNSSQILFNIKVREIALILNREHDQLAKFKNNIDEFDEIYNSTLKNISQVNGRRAAAKGLGNMLIEEMLRDAQTAVQEAVIGNTTQEKKNLRGDGFYSHHTYKYYYPQDKIINVKRKMMTLMYTHLYRTRFYVTYAQSVRKRYLREPRYKIGFCMSLMRQLLREMRVLVNGIKHFYYTFKHYTGLLHLWGIYITEKMQRYETDIRDLIQHVKNLEYERKMSESPEYYQELPSSTGRYSG